MRVYLRKLAMWNLRLQLKKHQDKNFYPPYSVFSYMDATVLISYSKQKLSILLPILPINEESLKHSFSGLIRGETARILSHDSTVLFLT